MGIEEKRVKCGHCLEQTGVEMGFGAANIQKERLMKKVGTEGHFEKGDSKIWYVTLKLTI